MRYLVETRPCLIRDPKDPSRACRLPVGHGGHVEGTNHAVHEFVPIEQVTRAWEKYGGPKSV